MIFVIVVYIYMSVIVYICHRLAFHLCGDAGGGSWFYPHLWGLSWFAGLAQVGLAIDPNAVVPSSDGG